MTEQVSAPSGIARILDGIERIGNKLPDPAVLFLILLVITGVISALLSMFSFDAIDPRTKLPIVVNNLLAPGNLTAFMAEMVNTFVRFHPLGVVLVAMLGIGVADASGFINAGLRALLSITAKSLLTPMLILVGIVSHTAVDAGYVLVVPLGAVIFHAAGRHPLAGIAAAFAGVSGGFSANFVPSSLDPLLQGLTQTAAQVLDPTIELNPLNNWFFTAGSCLVIILAGWYITDRLVEPRLSKLKVDGEGADTPSSLGDLSAQEQRALRLGGLTMLAGIALLILTSIPAGSAWRGAEGGLTSGDAPLMRGIVTLIFLLFIIPGVVYGYAAGTFKNHRDVIQAMSKSMSGMSYYIVMAFFAAQFIAAFAQSNLGALLAISGANALQSVGMPHWATVTGIIFLTGFVNLFVGSASAKWALLAPIFVPMLMVMGISPDLTQAAYRVGDSTTNIITPLMPYFPLVVVYCQRYVRDAGIGTLVSMMLPFSVVFLVLWTLFLMAWWGLGIPLGLQSTYLYTPAG